MWRLKLEFFRIMMYLSFPVGMFWLASEIQMSEQYSTRLKMLSPEKDYLRIEMEGIKERMRKKQEEKLLQAAKTDGLAFHIPPQK